MCIQSLGIDILSIFHQYFQRDLTTQIASSLVDLKVLWDMGAAIRTLIKADGSRLANEHMEAAEYTLKNKYIYIYI